jgi:hypothetical protein
MSAQSMDDDIIEVKLSKGSLAALAKAMGGSGGGLAGGKGKGGIGGLAGIAGKGLTMLGGIGIAIGAILGSVKALTGSSPMLKQMFKLMNFGIMMIFRPIGDFIGFMLRPILVMLLRNFIIPWYKDAMPIMQSMGAIFGSSIATDLMNFFKNPEQVIADGLQSLLTGTGETLTSMLDGTFDWTQLGIDLLAVLKTVFVDWSPLVQIGKIFGDAVKLVDWSSVDGVFSGVGAAFDTAVQKAWDDAWNGLAWELSFFLNDITKAWDDAWEGISWELSFIWNDITKKWDDAIDALSWELSFIWNDIETWFEKGLAGIDVDWDGIWDTIMDWLNPLTDSSSKNKNDNDKTGNFMFDEGSPGESYWNPLTWGSGGHITEPIAGIGKSGQQYLMGESGNETVVPDDQLGGGGITLNISVGNISSEGDMRNFESRVMEVLENANSRRGRV